ncbi:MAG: helix-turn-helix domain-containing protein [Odoribacter sp.]|nr:helix-turn-helix domain-containing protein [Odoribacter sp.]
MKLLTATINELSQSGLHDIDEEWLDSVEVCKRLSISKRTLLYYRNYGKVPYSFFGNKIYYKVSDITEILKKNRENKDESKTR